MEYKTWNPSFGYPVPSLFETERYYLKLHHVIPNWIFYLLLLSEIYFWKWSRYWKLKLMTMSCLAQKLNSTDCHYAKKWTKDSVRYTPFKNYLTAALNLFFIRHALSINWKDSCRTSLELIKIHVENVLTTNDLGIIVFSICQSLNFEWVGCSAISSRVLVGFFSCYAVCLPVKKWKKDEELFF